MLFEIAFLVVLLQHFTRAGENWGYEESPEHLGQDQWFIKYKNCTGNRQSPIEIQRDYLINDPTLKPLRFLNYDKPIKSVNVTNEGHTVGGVSFGLNTNSDPRCSYSPNFIIHVDIRGLNVLTRVIICTLNHSKPLPQIRVDIPEAVDAQVTSKAMNATYRLKQIHFHWGSTDNSGSEHVLFGDRFPLEMHMVHADESISFDKAVNEPFGLLVLSTLFNIGKENSELEKITSIFPQIADPSETTVTAVKNLDLMLLLPQRNKRSYYQYAGSLTTPPCNEAVQWIIFKEIDEICREQMANFRKLMKNETEADGNVIVVPIQNNDRNLQGIKGRRVRVYSA